jgi:hypothetical protein
MEEDEDISFPMEIDFEEKIDILMHPPPLQRWEVERRHFT